MKNCNNNYIKIIFDHLIDNTIMDKRDVSYVNRVVNYLTTHTEHHRSGRTVIITKLPHHASWHSGTVHMRLDGLTGNDNTWSDITGLFSLDKWESEVIFNRWRYNIRNGKK